MRLVTGSPITPRWTESRSPVPTTSGCTSTGPFPAAAPSRWSVRWAARTPPWWQPRPISTWPPRALCGPHSGSPGRSARPTPASMWKSPSSTTSSTCWSRRPATSGWGTPANPMCFWGRSSTRRRWSASVPQWKRCGRPAAGCWSEAKWSPTVTWHVATTLSPPWSPPPRTHGSGRRSCSFHWWR